MKRAMKKSIFAYSCAWMGALVSLFSFFSLASEPPFVIGSKAFTESVILGEIARLSLEQEGLEAEHRGELGGTRILWSALLAGNIDVYPEYTGTLAEEILVRRGHGDQLSFDVLKAELAEHGVGVMPPLGFNNTYAVGVKRELAETLGLSKISDLAAHPELKIGWGEEFRRRRDGWPGLKKQYGLPHRHVRGLNHDIAYRALESGDIQITDLYSTDAEIQYYDLTVLKDDRSFFPRYEALFIYRLDAAKKDPRFLESLRRLSGKISESEMISMNRAVKIDKTSAGVVAAEKLNEWFDWNAKHVGEGRAERIWVRTIEHLKLVLLSLFAAILFAIPLGVFAERFTKTGSIILSSVGIIQTIPALALLVVLIRPLNWVGLSGIGDTPALVALFLYSLLPMVRSTHTGLQQIPPFLRETSAVLGFSPRTRLLRIELPLALPSILAGIKTSAVLNVGFATLGALVGAGGYGQPILTGIRLDDYGLILEGALPAAILAILMQRCFDFLENFLVSPGLRT